MAQPRPGGPAAPPPPISPPPPIPPGGLSQAEADARAAAGLANVDTTRQRTDGDVVRSNVLTFFNVVLGSLILALFFVGEFRDGLFVGIVVIANVAVATLQELKATRTLRELVALTAPQVTVVRDGMETPILAEHIVQGDLIHLKQGDQVVADGHVTARLAEVDESLLTGESDSVRKGPGDELRSGSFCTAGDCYYTAEQVGVNAYAVRLTADARNLVRRSTPLQNQFNRILRVLLTATAVLAAMLLISYNVEERGVAEAIKATTATVTTVVPTGLLLGMTVAFAVGAVRVSRAGAIVQDINAVEALNYTDVICLDKTGTITANRLTLQEVCWEPSMEGYQPWLGAFVAESAGESKTAGALAEALAKYSNGARPDGNVPFSSERRWSAMRLSAGAEKRVFILGAPETVLPMAAGGDDLRVAYEAAAARGMRGVIFAEAAGLPEPGVAIQGVRPLALLVIGDVLRPEVRSAFGMMERLGIEPRIISGDNPHTVAALLGQLGIKPKGGVISGVELDAMDEDEFREAVQANSVFGRITPALKARIVTELREQGHFVAMCGDGANDVQALRAADVAVAMASGTATARAVAGIVLLNDSFEALIRGTKEATAVLGNAARLSKLFIAKSLYAYILIVATNMLGLDYPFLPRQGSVTALLTLGIPTVFISISVPPPDAGRDFTRNVLRWALPASLALASAAIIVHLLVQGLLDRGIEEARTLVSLTLGVTGLLFVLEVLGFEGASWRSLTRPVLTTALTAALLAAMFFTVYWPPLRNFFDFTQVPVGDWVIVGVAVAAALAGQYVLSRYWQQILDVLIAKPGKKDLPRGRAV
ncbi:MAG: HAD-IC family P-type ATPase [Dehalococcoidia bacterium]|nr:HAD-IC family P-type ATPase [Dehalococcoidia bacterium]